jgi:hypothetical protein
MAFATWTISLLLALGEGAPPAQPAAAGVTAAAKDPAAMALLKRMSDRLKAARTFTARGRTSLELPVSDGELATFLNDFELTVRRPDGLVAHRSGDLPDFRFAFNGKTMTAFAPGKKIWGTTSAPATLDAMLSAAGEQGGLSLPFDELVVADPFGAITAGLTGAVLAPQATVHGKKVEHLVLSSAALHAEYWVDPGTALPVRSLVIYEDHPLRPHFLVEYAEWKLDPKVSSATFDLPRPQSATQVDFGEAASVFR